MNEVPKLTILVQLINLLLIIGLPTVIIIYLFKRKSKINTLEVRIEELEAKVKE